MNPVSLTTLDYLIMAAYMIFLIAMSLYYRKFAQSSMDNFFLGGRNLNGWLNGTSYAATCMNADVAPAYCGMTVITGLYICWWYISRFGLALMIGGILFAVFWRRTKIFTSPEFYELRFSGAPAILMRSWVALRSAFIAVVAWTGAGLLGLSKVSEALLGWEKWQTFLVVIPVILIYVTLSGYMGVVMSDLIQTVIMIVASLILMGMVWADFGGPGGLYDALVSQFGTGVVNWHPPASHELLGVVGVIAWTVGTAIGYGGDVAPMAGAMEGQRLLSCRNSREASKMYIWTEVVLFLMLAVLTLPALGAMVKWPGLHDGTINKELSYGMLLGHYLPSGLLGLALIALFASIMSTVDSNMNFGAQVFINDVYRRSIQPDKSMTHYMRIGKIVMLVIMGLAILVAYHAQNVIDIAVFMLGLSSAELTANWGQWWWWRFNGKARLAASFGGPVIFLINKFLIFNYLIEAGPDTAYWVVLTSIAATCVLWILVSLFTKPDYEQKLVEFYQLARPLGWWNPIARKAKINPAGQRPILNGLGIALVGTVMVASGIIGFSCLYVAKWGTAIVAAIIAIISALYFRSAYRKNLGRFAPQEIF
ncbi:hypothetical protein EH223_11425 [candidate division KSB1 bacterium]|nr:MAG: hypothetical protein EH223_11425 [candidate division KSB1 bacterium]